MGEISTVRTYPQGVTSWIDVGTPDVDAAESFYGRLFGWTFETMTPPGIPAYAIARLDGDDVGGVGARDRAAWTTYVAVDDIGATVTAIASAGGRMLEPVEAAGEGGWSAVCTDPAGVELGLWQAKNRPGAQAVNRPGAWNFSDLQTDDPHGVEFFAEVFGWVIDRSGGTTFIQVPGYGDHLEATVDPDIRARQASAPVGFADVIGGVSGIEAGLEPHWHVTFTVADRDAAAATAERLGASVLSRVDGQWAKRATIRDPQGAVFTVSEFTPPDDSSFT